MALKLNTDKNNIRADMLSRLHNETDSDQHIAVIDSDEWVDPSAIPDDDIADILPLSHDGLDLIAIAR